MTQDMGSRVGGPKRDRKGFFLVIDGTDGSGKTTQLVKLVTHFTHEKVMPLTLCRDPGSTEMGEELRNLIKSDVSRCPMTEMLLFSAARAELIDTHIVPKLDEGHLVLCDRYFYSTVAYQGYAGGIPLTTIESITATATRNVMPDFTVILTCPLQVALGRVSAQSKDVIEKRPESYFQKVVEGYTQYARKLQDAAERYGMAPDIAVVDVGELAPGEVHQRILDVVEPRVRAWREN